MGFLPGSPVFDRQNLSGGVERKHDFNELSMSFLHSVQLAGDPDSERFLLTMIELDKASKRANWVRRYMINATETVLTAPELPPLPAYEIGGYPLALPWRRPVVFKEIGPPEVIYKAVECLLVPGANGAVDLHVRLFRFFQDSNPSRTYTASVPQAHQGKINLAVVYSPPNVADGQLMIIGFNKVDKKMEMACAWKLDPAQNPANALPTMGVPTKVSTPKQVRSSAAGLNAGEALTCDPCKIWIEYTPGEPDMVEFIQCGPEAPDGSNPPRQVRIDTQGHEVLEVTLHVVDFENCTSLFVEYRAWPPGNVSEVDCHQTKVAGVWGQPFCTAPSGLILLAQSKFMIGLPADPRLLEISMAHNDQGLLLSYERLWDSQAPAGASPYSCPAGQVSDSRAMILPPNANALTVHHASAKANSSLSYARTEPVVSQNQTLVLRVVVGRE